METSTLESFAFKRLTNLASDDIQLLFPDKTNLDGNSHSYSDEDFGLGDKASYSIRQNSGLKRLRINLLSTYKSIDSDYTIHHEIDSRQCLTFPSEVTDNNGRDNCESNLVVHAGDELTSKKNKYTVIDIIGQGMSGQVFEVSDSENNLFALKIIKNKSIYKKQALVELTIIKTLNTKIDKDDVYHIIRLYDYFIHHNHLCIIFELLNENLYQLLQHNHLQGISLNSIRFIIKQILEATEQIHKAKLIHCDMKPENILLKIDKENNSTKGQISIKVTDFGSACDKSKPMFTYIQSRYYRAPEVILGASYSSQIDIWSIGLIAAELYLGNPLLPGSCEYDQLSKIETLLGELPQYLIKGKNAPKYYTYNSIIKKLVLKTKEEYYNEFPSEQLHYYQIPFDIQSLDDLANIKRDSKVKRYSNANKSSFHNTSNNSSVITYDYIQTFIHFLKGLLNADPKTRWTAHQCLRHPFITKEAMDSFTMSNNEEHFRNLSSECQPIANSNASFSSMLNNISTNNSLSFDGNNNGLQLTPFNHHVNTPKSSSLRKIDNNFEMKSSNHSNNLLCRTSTISSNEQENQSNISGIMEQYKTNSLNLSEKGQMQKVKEKSKFSNPPLNQNAFEFHRKAKRNKTITYHSNQALLLNSNNVFNAPCPFALNGIEDTSLLSRPNIATHEVFPHRTVSLPSGGGTGAEVSQNQSFDTEYFKNSHKTELFRKSLSQEKSGLDDNFELIFDN